MSDVPMIPDPERAAIRDSLPINQQDRRLISAIAFRQSTATSLRDTSVAFAISRARLAEQETKLRRAGTLAQILLALGLQRAGTLQWRRGGMPSWRRHGADIVGMKLDEFGRQLDRNSPRKRRKAARGAVPDGA